MDKRIENKIKKIIADTFEISEAMINDETTTESIDDWSSLRHINLMSNLENEFNIKFDAIEIVVLTSYYSIKNAIKNKFIN